MPTPELLNALGDFIKSVGFPVFVAGMLLNQVYSMHRDNLTAISGLTQELKLLRIALQGKLAGDKED
jgi:hypothetical protein